MEEDEDDGWLAADDDIDDGDTDNDDVESANKTNTASKRKLESSSKRDTSSVCLISPYQGRPMSKYAVATRNETDRIDGVRAGDALDFLGSFVAIQLCDTSFNVDAYPPPLVDEYSVSVDPHTNDKTQPLSEECMKIFATFVHNCTHGSKDKVLMSFYISFRW